MNNIAYNYEIINVDTEARVTEIVYASEGRTPIHIGARLPYVGESLEAIIAMYSPTALWASQDAAVQTITAGIKGTHTPKVKTPAEIQAEIDAAASDAAKANLTQLRADTYHDVLAFLATLPGAPKSIKDAAVLAATEKAKVRP